MKKILIVVDMLNDFCHPNGVLSRKPDKVVSLKNSKPVTVPGDVYAAAAIWNIDMLVETFRDQNLPIIWLCDAHAKNDKEFDRFPAHAVRGTWGAQIINEFGPKYVERATNEIIIQKTRYSGFYGTELEYHLIKLAPKTVEVAGVCTSICIMDTVGGLANRDIPIHIQENCIADFDPSAHVAAIDRMRSLYGATII